MRMRCLAGLALLAGLSASLPANAQTAEIQDALDAALQAARTMAASKVTPPVDYLDFVFAASDRPVLLRLHLRNGARPYTAGWDDYMAKLYAHLDRSGDGVLNKAEAERAPDIQFLQIHLQGAIGIPYQGLKGQMAQLDSNKDGKVSLDEFKAFYRRGGILPFQLVSNSNRASTDTVTKTLMKRLDSNKDGKLSAEEVARAETALRRLDLDENEMLTTAELTPGGDNTNIYGYAGMDNGGPSSDMGFLEIKPEGIAAAAKQVLAHYDKDKNGKVSPSEMRLEKKLFAQLDANHDGQLDANEFAGFFRRDSDLELIGQIGKVQPKDGVVVALLREVGVPGMQMIRAEVFNPRKRDMPLAAKVRRLDANSVAFRLGDADIELAVYEPFSQFPRRFYERQFQLADVKKKGVIDRKQAMATQFLGQIFDLTDADGDGKLTQKELKSYLDMQTEGTTCRTQVTLTDLGRSLFDVLDANGDGNLSIRELRTAWSRMKPLASSDKGLSPRDIPRRLQASAGSAQRRFRPAAPVIRGNGAASKTKPKPVPVWFQKMDRNSDGDVSPREFIGSDEDFRKLDADGDGLISADEARRFEEKVNKGKDKKR
jgi:Ca2+-binding EF-hand superfamily protein